MIVFKMVFGTISSEILRDCYQSLSTKVSFQIILLKKPVKAALATPSPRGYDEEQGNLPFLLMGT